MRLVWDKTGERLYETGVSRGVLYLPDAQGAYSNGVAWNGLTDVSESPSGAEPTPLYADDIKYLNLISAEEYAATIEAYTYPDEFAACDGSAEPITGMYVGQQNRKKFGLCWRTEIGNANTDKLGYKLHVAYGLSASPTEKAHDTVNDSPEANPWSWDTEGTPVPMSGYKPTAKLEFDSTKLGATKMAALEALLYGTAGSATYTEFTGSTFVYGTKYYEEDDGVYFETEDTTPNVSKTYYTKSSTGGNAASLPTPDAILLALQSAT